MPWVSSPSWFQAFFFAVSIMKRPASCESTVETTMAYGPARQDIRATCAWTADCNILPVGADVGRATLQAMLAIGAYGLLQGLEPEHCWQWQGRGSSIHGWRLAHSGFLVWISEGTLEGGAFDHQIVWWLKDHVNRSDHSCFWRPQSLTPTLLPLPSWSDHIRSIKFYRYVLLLVWLNLLHLRIGFGDGEIGWNHWSSRHEHDMGPDFIMKTAVCSLTLAPRHPGFMDLRWFFGELMTVRQFSPQIIQPGFMNPEMNNQTCCSRFCRLDLVSLSIG